MSVSRVLRAVALLLAGAAPAAVMAQSAPQALTVDGPAVQQRLEANDQKVEEQYEDRYTLALGAGESVQIDLSSDDFDPYLAITAPGSEEPAAENDDGGEGLNARIRFVAPSAGTYSVRARGLEGNTGAYTLAVKRRVIPPTPVPAALTAGAAAQGRLSTDGALDENDKPYALYRIKGRKGMRVQIDMQSPDLDSMLRLKRDGGGAGAFEASDDDGGDELHSRLIAELPEDGDYIVTATTIGEEGGGYTVSLREYMPTRPPAPPARLTVGQTVDGRLAFDDPDLSILTLDGGSTAFGKLYALDLRAGETVVVDLGGEFDPVLDAGVVSPIGFAVARSNDDAQPGSEGEEPVRDARLVLRPDGNGTVYIRARSFDAGGLGTYRLRVSRGD